MMTLFFLNWSAVEQVALEVIGPYAQGKVFSSLLFSFIEANRVKTYLLTEWS